MGWVVMMGSLRIRVPSPLLHAQGIGSWKEVRDPLADVSRVCMHAYMWVGGW